MRKPLKKAFDNLDREDLNIRIFDEPPSTILHDAITSRTHSEKLHRQIFAVANRLCEDYASYRTGNAFETKFAESYEPDQIPQGEALTKALVKIMGEHKAFLREKLGTHSANEVIRKMHKLVDDKIKAMRSGHELE